MNFKNTHKNLESGKYFNTIWVALPMNCYEHLNKILTPIRKYCEWCTAVDTRGKPHTIPHITLRYLGYDSDELRNQLTKDKKKFSQIVRSINAVNIVVDKITTWKNSHDDNYSTVRLNWKIVEGRELFDLHQKLLAVNNYDFFTSLEGENFSPHISLAKVDLSIKNTVQQVERYLEKLETKPVSLTLSQFEINLASPIAEKNIQISLT